LHTSVLSVGFLRFVVQVGIYKALLDTASGLDYLHSIGVVHGDLKTANVLLKGSAKDVRGFMCKITDFGLSRVLDLDATHISTATYGENLSLLPAPAMNCGSGRRSYGSRQLLPGIAMKAGDSMSG
jgi:serine/threonine protein kinase